MTLEPGDKIRVGKQEGYPRAVWMMWDGEELFASRNIFPVTLADCARSIDYHHAGDEDPIEYCDNEECIAEQFFGDGTWRWPL